MDTIYKTAGLISRRKHGANLREVQRQVDGHPDFRYLILMVRFTLMWLLMFVLLGGSVTAAEDIPVDSETALDLWPLSADAQISRAQDFFLGKNGLPKDPVRAAKGVKLAADQGNAKAQTLLGTLYAMGTGVTKDSTEAVKWFRKAADQGLGEAQVLLGMAYAQGDGVEKNESEAARLYLLAARKGIAEAQFLVGAMYANGQGIPKDTAEAVNWYRLSAAQGNADSQNNLGYIYAAGEGVTSDSVEAVKWYRLAAEQGNTSAQLNLGNMYNDGNGVERDSAQAVEWWRKAAERGLAGAQFNLGTMYANARGVPKDSGEAVRWYLKAAEQGNANAQSNLGDMYSRGEGVGKNGAEALKWFSLAAKQGQAAAQFNLGYIYYNGDGVPKDSSEAARWYHKAAAQGFVRAQFSLGMMYAQGDGVPKDSSEALEWYHKAAVQGDRNAQGNLGFMYANGEGVPKDAIEGLAWSNIAAASGIEIFVKNRNILEYHLGTDATLAAQRRSKEILNEIESAKNKLASVTQADSPTPLPPAAESPKASGSGAIVSTEGYVLTAAHVVAGASRVKILTSQGMKNAKVLRIDEANDLAVLKLGDGTYPVLPVATSRKIRLGQTVATIGFPNVQIQGFSPKVTRGEISSLNGIGDDPRAWQISVPVQPGNSGGPLLDEYGNLVGVVVSKLGMKAATVTGDVPQNVNYAVKGSYALALLEPYLGNDAPEPNLGTAKPRFEDMVAKAQESVVLILVY